MFDSPRKGLTALLLALAVMFSLLPHPAISQVLFGSIVGSVTDASGAGVPGANVKVTQLETNDTRETKTNDSGGFTLSTVHAGTYKVEVKKEGFKNYTADNLQVSLNTVVRIDAALQVGAQSQSIEVSAAATALQTDRADVHNEFNTKQLIDLPQPTRNFEGIVALMPGIAPPSASGGGTNNPSKSFQISADGTSRSGTNVLIDGVSATNPWVQFFSTYAPSVEAIETVNVVTASSDAEQSMTNGASINVQTKSGTNDLHGSLYEYHVSSAFKARPYFLPANQGIPKLIENDLGATVGGRIIKNKLFYFGSYEGDFVSQGNANSSVTVPTDAIRQGNLSGSPTPIFDPATGTYDAKGIPTGRTPFPGNIIPASRIHPASAKLIALVPSPNQNLSAVPANNYYVNTPISNKLQHIDTKFDWIASTKWKLTGRYGYQPYNITQGTVFGPVLGGGNNAFQFGNASAYAITASWVASPTFVADASWGRTFAHQVLNPPSIDKKAGSDTLGIPGTNLGSLPYAGGLPQFNISNYNGYGYAYTPLQYDDPVSQYSANATWIKGAHNIRFGTNISQQHMNHFESTPTSFGFNGGATQSGPGGASVNAFNSYADFLLGLPQSYTNSPAPTKPITLRTWQYSLYLRDQWQVNRKLTVSIGTGWEYYPVPTRADRQIESYNFATNQILICGSGPNKSNCGITVQKNLFSPRIGIAYRPMEGLVIRAGYSLSPEQINMFRDGIYNYPTRADFTNNGLSTYDPVGSLTTGIPIQQPPDISSGVINTPRGVVLGAIIPANSKFIRGYTESMNFTVQKDIGHGWVGQVGYVGTLSIHQHTRYNINYGTLNGGSSSQPFFPLGVTGGVVEILPYETQRYNSLQAQLNRRFSNGFQMGAAYTRSKIIGLCCDDSGDGAPQINLPQYANLNRAIMGSDRPNNFRLSALYDLPFGKGKQFLANGVGSAVAGGWHIQSVFSKYSGSPFSASGGSALNTPGFNQRAQQVKQNVTYFGNHGPGQLYFDTSAFAAVTAPGVIGNTGYNTLRGPGVTNLDMSVFRDFKVWERFSIQFRAEALNATNTPHFSNPQGNVTNSTFGQITSTTTVSRLIDERYLRFGLKIRF